MNHEYTYLGSNLCTWNLRCMEPDDPHTTPVVISKTKAHRLLSRPGHCDPLRIESSKFTPWLLYSNSFHIAVSQEIHEGFDHSFALFSHRFDLLHIFSSLSKQPMVLLISTSAWQNFHYGSWKDSIRLHVPALALSTASCKRDLSFCSVFLWGWSSLVKIAFISADLVSEWSTHVPYWDAGLGCSVWKSNERNIRALWRWYFIELERDNE